jgi:pimeloyl-ACP methyl ester carboxylesterase
MKESEKTLCVTGLRHHVLDWPASSESPPIVLVHGWMDSAASFRAVARALQARGRRVLAPDLRGYGDTEHIHEHATYYFPDFVRDLHEVLEALGVARLDLVGHSMGGSVCSFFAGAFPERVRRLVNLEGLGPDVPDPSEGIARTRAWITSARAPRRAPRGLRMDDVVGALVRNHPRVPRDVLERVAPTFVRAGDDGLYRWKADPRHRELGPLPFNRENLIAHLRAITAPKLFVDGGETGWHPRDEAARLDALAPDRRLTLEGAGHMMHWTRPAELAEAIGAFVEAP